MGRRKKSPPADDPMDDPMAYFTDADWHRMSIHSLESLRQKNTRLRPKIEQLRRLLISGGAKDGSKLSSEIHVFIDILQSRFDLITWKLEAHKEHKLSTLKDKIDACIDALEHRPTAFRMGIANPAHDGHPDPAALLYQVREMTVRALALPAVNVPDKISESEIPIGEIEGTAIEAVDLKDKLSKNTKTTVPLAMLPLIGGFWKSMTGELLEHDTNRRSFPYAVMEYLQPYNDKNERQKEETIIATALKTYIGRRNKQLGIRSHGGPKGPKQRRKAIIVFKSRPNSRR